MITMRDDFGLCDLLARPPYTIRHKHTEILLRRVWFHEAGAYAEHATRATRATEKEVESETMLCTFERQEN